MLLYRLVDAVVTHLDAALPAATQVGSAMPRLVAEIPAVVLSLADAQPLGSGVGGRPRGEVGGALAVRAVIDLADPVWRFADGEAVPLLSADRRTLQLPWGALVDADGGDAGPLASGAVTLRRGALVYALVEAAPGPNQVRVERSSGIAVFGAALPATGSLGVEAFVGRWEVETVRFTATLQAMLFAGGAAALELLSRQVADAMSPASVAARVPGLSQVLPTGWSAMAPPEQPRGNTLARTLAWQCRYEYEVPSIPTAGGPIRGVAVALSPRPGAAPEPFTVARS